MSRNLDVTIGYGVVFVKERLQGAQDVLGPRNQQGAVGSGVEEA